jgi:hypothetical protein
MACSCKNGKGAGYDADGDGYGHLDSPKGRPTPMYGGGASAWGFAAPGADGQPGKPGRSGGDGGGRRGASPQRYQAPEVVRRRPRRDDVSDTLSDLAGTLVPVAIVGLAVAGITRWMGW